MNCSGFQYTIHKDGLKKLELVKNIYICRTQTTEYTYSIHIKVQVIINVPNGKSRNIPEVVIVRRGAGGVLGIWEGWVNGVKGGANGVSLQAT